MNGPVFNTSDYYVRPGIEAYSKPDHALHQLYTWGGADASATMDNHPMLPSTAYMHTDSHPAPPILSPIAGPGPSTSSSLSHAHQSLHDNDSALYLTYGGEILPINLQALDDSPDRIISTLRISASHPVDCGKWMMVGATYRGRGNLQAAIAVISAMIEGESSRSTRPRGDAAC